MKRLSVFAIALSFFVAACGGTATSPSAVRPTFTAVLSPANEVPAISDSESSGSGNVTVTFDTTSSGGNITAATATFVAQLSGFPPNTPINIAHIHPGAVGVNGGILVNTQLTAGDLVLTNGSGTFTKGPVTMLPEVAQQIMNNPAGYYFNVHSTAHPGGVARGQLQRVQ
jgi:ABC-type glycerol-3-phosphate transport system substrate-binding protein